MVPRPYSPANSKLFYDGALAKGGFVLALLIMEWILIPAVGDRRVKG
jgi:hypothetical protein